MPVVVVELGAEPAGRARGLPRARVACLWLVAVTSILAGVVLACERDVVPSQLGVRSTLRVLGATVAEAEGKKIILPACPVDKLQDATRINDDASSPYFRLCAQICLNPKLKAVAAKHGVRYGETCASQGCTALAATTTKAAQAIFFYSCDAHSSTPERGEVR
ncbi:hypothetical protein KFE25_005844 [Diacronema lutheri]|uniref:Uncharacterized protein n=1 Tax=Diacronema lutheri TaxID=2081491 RepID=A0A8J6CE79_DIALT|nr:hypothetical protein KFE25_005844 [Diacronema lutheri]